MNLSDHEILKRLGSGASIDQVCASAAINRSQFDKWWAGTIQARVPKLKGTMTAQLNSAVVIERDAWGIPHVLADNDSDLFFGFGVAVAHDRLFQLDYLRRRGMGRLSEVLGESAVPLDTVARTVGLPRIASAEWERLDDGVRQFVEAFSSGVNHVIAETQDCVPIEFDLLDYRPEPWRPIDCLVIESEFRWYLTGRLPVIAIPELAKRALGPGPRYDEFLLGEAESESIIHQCDFDSSPLARGSEPVGHVMNDPDAAIGSNNWVLAGHRTTTGHPLLCSDPHIAFQAVSCWHEIHLSGGSFNVAGMSYVGIPAVMFGCNDHVSWGITNNICSIRDLYQERTDPGHPGCFLYEEQWEPEQSLTETIHVRDAGSIEKTIRFSRNGPIVDELLPAGAENTGPVSLKWLGAYQGGWLTAMLNMDRAECTASFREALRPWHVPTFSLVIADAGGSIAMQTAGRIPIRDRAERGYRNGWDPADQWRGLIPFDSLPTVTDPERGWIASANNRLAPNDFPYNLSGCWSNGFRAVRIRQMIESQEKHSPVGMRDMHQDTKSLRAAALVPLLIPILADHNSPRFHDALKSLKDWDFQSEANSRATAVFNVFFNCWCRTVAEQRFGKESIPLVSNAIGGCASRLLTADPTNWFEGSDRIQCIIESFECALNKLTELIGPDAREWEWGRLHSMPLKHVLSDRGVLSELLDHGGAGIRGDMVTVCNTGSGVNWTAATGAGYRLLADLSRQPPVLQAIDAQSQSGHPGSPHYNNQFDSWRSGKYHEIPLSRDGIGELCVARLTMEPLPSGTNSI